MEHKYPRIISADSHVMEPLDLWFNALGKKFGDRTPRVLSEYQGQEGTFFFSGRQVAKLSLGKANEAGLGNAVEYLPDVRVQFQDQSGVDAEVRLALQATRRRQS